MGESSAFCFLAQTGHWSGGSAAFVGPGGGPVQNQVRINVREAAPVCAEDCARRADL